MAEELEVKQLDDVVVRFRVTPATACSWRETSSRQFRLR